MQEEDDDAMTSIYQLVSGPRWEHHCYSLTANIAPLSKLNKEQKRAKRISLSDTRTRQNRAVQERSIVGVEVITVESREYIISANGTIGWKLGFLYNSPRELRREMVLKAFFMSKLSRLQS
jgi:hypothetical protein